MTELPDAEMSLRERKKLRTRRTLIATSQQLFREQGYAKTTLDEISAAAEIGTPTLLRYFPSKAHLAHASVLSHLERFEAEMSDPARATTALALWRSTIADLSSTNIARTLGPTHAWMRGEPSLRALSAEIEQRFERVLAKGIASDDEVDPSDVYSHLLAALLSAGNRAVYRSWLKHEGPPETLVATQLAALDTILASFPTREVYDREANSARRTTDE